jgi:pyruvate kinase
MPDLRRTKIVATLGPAVRQLDTLTRLISAGADVLRVNFSHGTPDEHADLIELARQSADRSGREVALLGDLPGPKLRLGDIEGDVVELSGGSRLVLTTTPVAGDSDCISVSWSGLPGAVDRGDTVFLADGSIRLRVTDSSEEEVVTQVEVGGSVASHQGINVPRADAPLPTLGEADLAWVDFAVEQGIDLLAVSFVGSREDLAPVETRLDRHGADTPLIAKIENARAADNAEEIVKAASGIMVARGDLGIELSIEKVPLIQKQLLSLGGRYSKPSITATQMLASMVRSSRPTRAEVADVANAIYEGTDAVMLSEETAVGRYPIDAVRIMVEIATETERNLPYGEWLLQRVRHEHGDVASTVAYGAVAAVYQLGLAALVVPTSSGRTARLVSAHRPNVPILALSPRAETVRRLNLLFGVTCLHHDEPDSLNQLLESCARRARETGVARSGDLIGVTAGLAEQRLGTNLFEVRRVP